MSKTPQSESSSLNQHAPARVAEGMAGDLSRYTCESYGEVPESPAKEQPREQNAASQVKTVAESAVLGDGSQGEGLTAIAAPDVAAMNDNLAEVGQVLEMCRSMFRDIMRRAPGVKQFCASDAFILNEINPALVKVHQAAALIEKLGQQDLSIVIDAVRRYVATMTNGEILAQLSPPPPERP